MDHRVIKLLVKNILLHAGQYEWTLHGFGMLRTYLDRETRLHVWDRRHQIENVSIIHDHPWNFRSYVIAGRIHNCVYDIVDSIEPNHFMNTIQCGVDAHCVSSSVEEIALKARNMELVSEGHSYMQRGIDLHRTDFESGSITLIDRNSRLPGKAGDEAHSAWPIELGIDGWVSAEPRLASPEEVSAIVKNSLDRHF